MAINDVASQIKYRGKVWNKLSSITEWDDKSLHHINPLCFPLYTNTFACNTASSVGISSIEFNNFTDKLIAYTKFQKKYSSNKNKYPHF